MAFESLDSGNTGELGTAQRAAAGDDELSRDVVATVGLDFPQTGLVVPPQSWDSPAEKDLFVQSIMLTDVLGMLKELWLVRVLLLGNVV